jgi:hypothetical protein
MPWRIVASAASCVLLLGTSSPAQAVLFVDADAAPGGDGASWATAFSDLATALRAAAAGDSVWVAEGLYLPDGGTGDPALSFEIPAGVSVFGGFAGTEASLAQRVLGPRPTILSGDLEGDDGLPGGDDVDNAHHVVRVSGGVVVLDGVAVRRGVARHIGGHTDEASGGGVLVVGGELLLRNSTLSANRAADGGGVAVIGGALTLDACVLAGNRAEGAVGDGEGGGLSVRQDTELAITGCLFAGNLATLRGGGMFVSTEAVDTVVSRTRFVGNVTEGRWSGTGGGAYVELNTSAFRDCSFEANRSGSGGGVYSFDSPLVYERCTFVGNSVTSPFGAAFGSMNFDAIFTLAMCNCLVWGNVASATGPFAQVHPADGSSFLVLEYSLVEDLAPFLADNGPGNLDADPIFADSDGADGIAGTLDDDLRLAPDSPGVDAGDPGLAPLGTDLLGVPRVQDGDLDGTGTVDIGAHETSHITLLADESASPGGPLAVSLHGTAGLPALLVIAAAPGETSLPGLGAALFDIESPFVVLAIGPLPQALKLHVPANLITPATGVLQAFVAGPGAATGNTSAAAAVTIVP